MKTVAASVSMRNWLKLNKGSLKTENSARFGSTYTKIGTIQRLAWPLCKDDTQIREAFHIFYTE